jgi:hypothetical protein
VTSPPLPRSITPQYAIIQAVAPSLGVELHPIDMRDPREIERAVAAFAHVPNGGLIIVEAPSVSVHRQLIITLAARHQLPAVFPIPYLTRSGGLIVNSLKLTPEMSPAQIKEIKRREPFGLSLRPSRWRWRSGLVLASVSNAAV